MDLQCYRCNSRRLFPFKEFLDCRTCGYSLEKSRYGLHPLARLVKKPVEPEVPEPLEVPEAPQPPPRRLPRKPPVKFRDPGKP